MILNLTQHPATPAQKDAGVVDVENTQRLKNLLTVQVSGYVGIAELTPTGQRAMLHARASDIMAEFVCPVLCHRATLLLDSSDKPFFGINAYNYVREQMALRVMVTGFQPLVAELVKKLKAAGCVPVCAISDRVSKEETLPDGTVRKTNDFIHCGFYEL
jgi:hypothetical protein